MHLHKAFLSAVIVLLTLSACGSSASVSQSASSSAAPQASSSEPTPPPAPSSPFFTGNGGRGMSIAILAPQATGLANDQDYISALVQGEFVSNFSGYSAISVLDRQRLDSQYKELLSGYYADDAKESWDLGRLAPTDYIMGGSITRTASGYAMQMSITKSSDKMTTASYSQTITFSDLDNLSGVRRASLDLLQKMGVTPTQRTQTELSGAAAVNQVNAQTALARGISAQQSGTEVAALSYFFQASAFDSSLKEASSRASTLNVSISSGSMGANIRDDIQRRTAWIARLTETEQSINKVIAAADPPFTLFYSTGIRRGAINYQTETVNLFINTNLRANQAWFDAISKTFQVVRNGLDLTGRRSAWGLQDWPAGGARSPFSNRDHTFLIEYELVNEQNKVIGKTTKRTKVSFHLDGFTGRFFGSVDDERGSSSLDNIYGQVNFNVNANDISDKLTIRIASVNGAPPQNARFPIIALSDSKFKEYRDYTDDFRIENGTFMEFKGNQFRAQAIIHTKQYENLVIPAEVWGEPITSIAMQNPKPFRFYRHPIDFNFPGTTSVIISNGITSIGVTVFAGNQLTSVIIPSSVTSIEDEAFHYNRLTNVIIPNSVTSIGGAAFRDNRLTSIIIPDSVISIGNYAFHSNLLTSIIIPNGVTSIGNGAFGGDRGERGHNENEIATVTIGRNVKLGENVFGSDDAFKQAYEANGRKAGRYTYNERRNRWSYSAR